MPRLYVLLMCIHCCLLRFILPLAFQLGIPGPWVGVWGVSVPHLLGLFWHLADPLFSILALINGRVWQFWLPSHSAIWSALCPQGGCLVGLSAVVTQYMLRF